VCTRAGDAAKDDVIAEALAVVSVTMSGDDEKLQRSAISIHCLPQVKSTGWSLLSVELSSGQVTLQQPLKWPGQPDLLLCMA
jgi:hypothetical protein